MRILNNDFKSMKAYGYIIIALNYMGKINTNVV